MSYSNKISKSLITVFRTNLYLTGHNNNIINHGILFKLPVRNLYASTTLGIDNYLQIRKTTKQQFIAMLDKFKIKMNECVDSENGKQTSIIFTEDLKNMIHLTETETDISLVIKMMKKFNQQNRELRFGNFVFGPVIMRMFYVLNEPNKALECFKAPELQGLFDQLMTYQILLDLLYENKKYDEVINTFELIASKQIQGTKYPKNIVVLTMAACYKQNTKESLEFALRLWSELSASGHFPMRRAVTFCAGLALNHGRPDAALEIVSSVKKQNYVTVRNIKVVALAKLGRTDDLLLILKSVLNFDAPDNTKHTFFKDVLEIAREVIEKQSNPSTIQEFQKLEKILSQQGYITDRTLDELLCSEITSPPTMTSRYQMQNNRMQPNMIPRYQYDQQKTNKYRVFNQRPGLTDMH